MRRQTVVAWGCFPGFQGEPGCSVRARPGMFPWSRTGAGVLGRKVPNSGALDAMQQFESYRKTPFFVNHFTPFGCKRLCAAKPLFRQEKGDAGEILKVIKVSRTNPSLPVGLEGKGGPEIFKGRRRAYAPRHIPDRFPVTAGIRSETATRPLGLALFSRLDSQRRTAFLRSPSSQCWPWVLRVYLPPSFFSWTSFSRLSFSCPLPFLMPSSWTISFYLMLSSFSFSCRLF